MSRWVNDFNNHAFQHQWSEIVDLQSELRVSDTTITTNVEELARFKKVVTYIDELILACDPELVPMTIWNQVNDQSMRCLAEARNYVSSDNIGHITNANAHLDNILTYVRPYIVGGKGAAQAAGKAFKAYSDSIHNDLSSFSGKIEDWVHDTEVHFERSERLYEDTELINNKMKRYEVQLIDGDDDTISVKKRIEKLSLEVEQCHSQVSNYHNELLDDEETSIQANIARAYAKIIDDRDDINEKLTDTDDKLTDLKKYYNDVFGVLDNETGERHGGLEKEVQDRVSDLDEFSERQKSEYNALLSEIERLLPGATSAGLATSYKELKDSFKPAIESHTTAFYWSLVLLLITAFITVISDIGWFYIKFIEISDPTVFFNSLMHKLPLIAPVLWLAIFSSKRRSEANRLYQEYAHKEALARSYVSFKKQIGELNVDNEDLSPKLLESIIEAVSYNASATLDGSHEDSHPVSEIVRESIKALKERGDSN